ncbi:MAG TPA: TspO/MBR family protein [Chitinophagaceae bacterium]|jgi:tryptophan-rich sensory protein|nr:TspO/MBR family protein [Chitinophagaceae bacterium]
MSTTVKLVISIAIPLLIGITGGLFTSAEIPGWYQTIRKPSWNPPSWLFGPVWTILYILMGIALFLIWKSAADSSVKNTAMYLFAAQMIFNFFWSFIFFRQHQIGWAFAEIVALWLLILLTIFAFGKISSAAAWLLVPYIAWVSFAAILNFTIWRLNAAT